MELFLVVYDNGEKYSDNDNYVVIVFDDVEKAKNYCINKGYSETETEFYYEMKYDKFHVYNESLEIKTINVGEEIEY